MNVRNPMGVLHLVSIKNIFHDKMNFRFFFLCDIMSITHNTTSSSHESNMPKILHYNTYILFLRYVYVIFVKCLFRKFQKQ